MKNRFKKTESDTKENLLSPNPGLFSPTNKKSFFNNPTSPVSSPKKKFFAPVEKEEPVYAVVSKPEPKITKSIINDMSYQSPTKLNRSPSRALSPNREQALSPTREPLSPSRQALTPTKSFSQTSTSPSRGRANSPVRPLSSASFKKFGDQVKRSPTPERRAHRVLSPERNIEHAVRTTSREPTAPARSVSLRQSPSMRQVEKLVEPTEVLETKPAVLQKPKITVKPSKYRDYYFISSQCSSPNTAGSSFCQTSERRFSIERFDYSCNSYFLTKLGMLLKIVNQIISYSFINISTTVLL